MTPLTQEARVAETERRHGLSEEEAKGLCQRVLSFAKADATRVNVTSGRRGFTRTAMNRVTAIGNTTDVTVRVTSVFGRRVASIGTNRTDDRSVERTVRTCEALARLSPEDPEYMPELGAQPYAVVSGYYPSTGNLTAEDQARSASLAVTAAATAKTVAAGFIDVRVGSQAVATSKGLFGYHQSTGVASTLTVRTLDGSSSGWAGDEAADWTTIESSRIVEDALRKCREWRGKTALEPGRYEAILEPAAVGMLMQRMMDAFDARSADEGRSYFSKRGGGTLVGEKLFDDRVTITSDPSHMNGETSPFMNTGDPLQKQVWVDAGVLKQLAYTRFWADRQGVRSRPSMANFIMSGGDATLDDMIKSVTRGVLLTHFWYIRPLNPRLLSETGLTRDGTFLIENGRITRPVTNFRFNQSLGDLLKHVQMLGRPTRVCASESSAVATPIVVPPMKVGEFNLASVSDAI